MLSNEPFYLTSAEARHPAPSNLLLPPQSGLSVVHRDSLSVPAEHAPEEEAFLMLHGLGGGVYEMSPLARQLHAAGHAVMGINYPGHDAPTPRMPDSEWPAWAEAAEAAYIELASRHQRVSIIGFSTGCLLALRLAASQSVKQAELPVHRLILLSPFLKIRQAWYYPMDAHDAARLFGGAIGHVPRLRLPITDREMHGHAMQACYFKTFNLRAVKSALTLIETVRPTLPTVTTPTLVIQSRQDRVVCPSGAETLMRELGSPHKQVIWLSRSDHVILLDTERQTVTHHILEFITENNLHAANAPG